MVEIETSRYTSKQRNRVAAPNSSRQRHFRVKPCRLEAASADKGAQLTRQLDGVHVRPTIPYTPNALLYPIPHIYPIAHPPTRRYARPRW